MLRLDPGADRAFREWEGEVERMLDQGGVMEAVRDRGAKLAGATLRVAAVLHCLERRPDTPMTEATVRAAVRIAEYLVPHAEAVLGLMAAKEDTGDADAQYVLRWIKRNALREFTKRDAHQHGKQRFPRAEPIDPALATLVARHYIRPVPAPAAGPGAAGVAAVRGEPGGTRGRPRREPYSHFPHSDRAVGLVDAPSRAVLGEFLRGHILAART